MAIGAQGTVIAIQTAAGPPAVFTTIGEITRFQGPALSRSVLDVTNITDALKRSAGGLLDPGEVTADLRLNYGDAGQDAVRAAFAANTRTPFKITIPAGALGGGASSTETVLTFTGYVTRYQISGEMDGVLAASISIRLDTVVTEA